jgi:glycosyltransferase involved in cell wall biosynthesis
VDLSVVVPAHNEAAFIGRCLASIGAATELVGEPVEVVVVANRCTDDTAAVARAAGAAVVDSEARNIAAVRNAGVAASGGDAIVTIDADCTMSPLGLVEVRDRLASGRYVGGGTKVLPERWSAGIRATYGLVEVMTAVTRLGGGMFWTHRADFDAVGGFDEARLIAEDLEFARRLRAHGRLSGRQFTNIRSAPIVASCRKFDRFGDWHMFGMARQLREIRAVVRGRDTAWVDRYFFDFNDDPPAQ